MSDPIKSGGPAFPNPALADENWTPFEGSDGMTLRDYFAGQALPVLVELALTRAVQGIQDGETNAEWAARQAFGVADAMIAVRGGSDD